MYALTMEYSNNYNTVSKKVGFFDDLDLANAYLTFLSTNPLTAFVSITMSPELLEFIKPNIPVKISKKFKNKKDQDFFSAALSILDFQKIRNKIPGKRKIKNWHLHIQNDVSKTVKKNQLNKLDKVVAKKIARQLFSAADVFASDVSFKIEEIKIVTKAP